VTAYSSGEARARINARATGRRRRELADVLDSTTAAARAKLIEQVQRHWVLGKLP